jgi:ribosomal protein S3
MKPGQYFKSRQNDNKIKYNMLDWRKTAQVPKDGVIQYFKYKQSDTSYRLIVITDYPGYLIGKEGQIIKYYAALMKCCGIDAIDIVEERNVKTT